MPICEDGHVEFGEDGSQFMPALSIAVKPNMLTVSNPKTTIVAVNFIISIVPSEGTIGQQLFYYVYYIKNYITLFKY